VASKASKRRARPWGTVVCAVLCAGLVVGTVSPSWAGESQAEGEAALVAPFPLGGAIHGAIDPRTGAFSIDAPLGALGLSWDSRASGADSFALGAGWSLAGIARVETKGGVRVHPSKSAQLSFAASESAPSGLAGYEGADVRFSQIGGVLPARADGAVGERPYAFVLHELGGLVSYFDPSGMPIAKFDAHDNRMDWEWRDARRLGRVVTADGVVTSLDWSDPSRVVVESRAGVDGPSRAIGTIELEGTRVSGVVDATGDRTAVRYAVSGLVSQITTASGAATDLRWRAAADGTATVDRVSVVDPSTAEQVIDRRWEPVAGLASGWPAVDAPAPGVSFTSALTDGTSRVTSTYDGDLGMTARETAVITPSGERSVQRQTFSYPEGDTAAVHAGRPSRMELTSTNASGATRTIAEGFVFDEYGRVVEMRDAAGFSVRMAYRSRQSEGVNATVTSGPDGVTVVREQDVVGRLSRTTDNIRDGVAVDGHTRVSETREYPSTNSTRVTDAWGWETTTEQDAFGRTTRATVSSGLSQVVDIDEVAGTQSSGATMTGDLDDAELVTTQQIDLRGQVTGTSAVRADGLPSPETLVDFDGLGRKTLAADGTRYAYNARNLTVQEATPEGTTLRTSYWATGDRARLTSTADAAEHTTGFYWDDGTMLNDVHTVGGATTSASYLLGVAREARTLTDAGQSGDALAAAGAAGAKGAAAPVYTVHDRHGSTTELTSSAGEPTSRFTYSDHGSTTHTPASGQPDAPADEATRFPFLYAGEYTNPTGTQHLAVRTYASDRFGFTSLDTEALQNKYGYADANPIMNVDPTGHFAWNDVFNGIVIGAAVLFSVVTAGSTLGMAFPAGVSLATTITTNAASFAFGGLSLLAGATGTAIATSRFIAEHTDLFIDEDLNKQLATAEYVLAGFSALTSIAGVLSSPKVVDRLSKAWKSLGSSTAAPKNVHVDARWVRQRLIQDDALLPTLPGANEGVQNVVTRFLEGTRAAIKQMNNTKVISSLRVDSVGAGHPVLEALDRAQVKLHNLWWDYWRTAQNSWKGGPPLGEELAAYIITKRPAFRAIATDVSATVQRAREGGAVQEWLDELIKATEPPAEFVKHSDYVTIFGTT